MKEEKRIEGDDAQNLKIIIKDYNNNNNNSNNDNRNNNNIKLLRF